MSDNFKDIPFDKIVSFGQKTLYDRLTFSVSWVLGRFCNYNCSYCWPFARTNDVDHYDLDTYKNTADQIKKQARENDFFDFHWSFSGGEPTTYKKLVELSRHIQDDPLSPNQSIHMTTNLSAGSKWWDSWCKNTTGFSQRYITASFHDEFADEQVFGDKCLQLQENDVLVIVNQVMVLDRFWELYDRCVRLHNRGINVTLKPQWTASATSMIEGYSDKQFEIMQSEFPLHYKEKIFNQVVLFDHRGVGYDFDQAERLNAYDFNKFKGWTCNSGFQSVVVRGNIVKRSYSCNDQSLGTMTEGFRLYSLPKVCSTRVCANSVDTKIPKSKN